MAINYLKGIDNLVYMVIKFTLLYIFVHCFKIQWLVLPSVSLLEADILPISATSFNMGTSYLSS